MSFGEVRSLLQKQPSAHNWNRLCDLLDDFEPHELDDMVFPYVLGATRNWQATLCVAPRRWVLRTLAGDSVPFWSIVRTIDLSSAYLSDAQMNKLLKSDRLNHVHVLDLDSNRIGLAGAKSLARASSIERLDVLKLGYNGVLNHGLDALLGASFSDNLKVLNLEANGLTHAAIVSLCDSVCTQTLTSLNLRKNKLNGDDFYALTSAGLSQLEHLSMDHCNLSRGNGLTGPDTVGFDALVRLDLRRCNLNDRMLAVLANCRWMSRVETLDISHNEDIGHEGLESLVDSPYTNALRVLYMERVNTTIEKASVVSALPSLEKVSFAGMTFRLNGPFNPF